MIIVKLMGGMGNQMFQYALGRHLALKNNTTLKLEISMLNNHAPIENFTHRTYELGVFNITGNLAENKDRAPFKFTTKNAFQNLKFRIKHKFQSYHIIQEEHLRFDEGVLHLKGNLYLHGYWQSEKYFKSIEHIIRADFTFNRLPEGLNKELINKINQCNAVSIHIRRGDYITDAVINKIHGVCSLDYYYQAIQLIASKVSNPHFFIFSDDKTWITQEVKINYPHTFVIENRQERSYEDMRLMSLCKHHILANSSFSWWGAWLNPHPDKIVITPKKWFSDESFFNIDMIPEKWIKL